MVLVAAAAAGVSVAGAIARARVVSGAVPTDDALDDLRAVAGLAPPAFTRLVDWALTLVPTWRCLDLRRHPWRFCLLVAAACGVALAAWHGVAEGGVSVAWRPLVAGLAIASIEASAVLACFAAFGRSLGIRRR
jgi:hypothetical protein